MADRLDFDLRRAAIGRVRELQRRYDDLIPLAALKPGFEHAGRRISFGSFYSGIFRPRQMDGPAALCLVTAPPKSGQPAPYEDTYNAATGSFVYHFRDPRSSSPEARRAAEADNRTLVAAQELAVPLIHFRGIGPAQYAAVAPIFVVSVDRSGRTVGFVAGLPHTDLTPAGLVSEPDARRYATYEARHRLHQHAFRYGVLRAYRHRCAVCQLREAQLLQAAHIVEDTDPCGAATVVNGLALCAIHHLAYDRNLLGIDPGGVVHIARRLLDEVDGPMLRTGLQGFHGAAILQPRRPSERPDPRRLEAHFGGFLEAA